MTLAASGPWRYPPTVLAAALALALALPQITNAQSQSQRAMPSAVTLDTVQVVGQRRPLSDFPGAVSVLDAETLHRGQRQVSLAESLARVPGVSVLDRQNYAQDLQIQSRGFGARSTFGIRGIKLVVDGIPASAVDGQGQAANFPLDMLDRIEVLRGPLALQYGNAAGGAIVGYTELEAPPGIAVDAWAGSDDSHRLAVRADGGADDWRWRMQGSHFATDGERPHSAAERSQFGALAQWSPRDGERLRLVVNSLVQPDTQDPLGLTRGALRDDPHGSDPAAALFDTRKRIGNHQLGLRWENDYAPGRSAWVGGYGIQRDVVQFLALPVGAQVPASSAGGVIDLGRRSYGIDAGHRWSDVRGSFALGVEGGRLDEARRGYENFVGTQLGVRGRLRRDDDNRIDSRELYALGDWHPATAWTLLGAVRRATLDVQSRDHFMAAGNGDDSGRLSYHETAASLGVARAWSRGEWFASAGRGFETPTVTELAYRPDGTAGFNSALKPAHYLSAETGARWRFGAARASIAVYRVEGRDEIVPADSRSGRASFANAGRTRRDGIELSLDGPIGEHWSYAVTANAIRARFIDSYRYRVSTGAASTLRDVQAGNRIPGIPRADGFAELAWHAADDAISAAVEARVADRIATDDRNTDAAAGNARLALRLDWRLHASGWRGFARVDNVFDRDYVGSVIVNEGNARYFEPGAGRSITIGLGWQTSR